MPDIATHDTIVAISTPPGRGAIGIVRLSGPESLTIARRLFKSRRELPEYPFRTLRGDLCLPDSEEVFDDVIGVYFPSPRSFTGEDVVEFHCHGAPVVLQQAVESALQCGARAANPGEFTMRAFLNGQINLTQAEGIRDLIHAQTAYQASLAARQVRGALSVRLQPAKEALLTLIVHLESAVEFVEENLDTHSRATIVDGLAGLEADITGLLATYRAGHLVRSGVNLAIIGRPNVGKSSLFNALLDADRAIVTDVPGTTRDTLAETVAIGGVPVRLVDTAGIRDALDAIERIGVERSYVAFAEADVVLLVLDAPAGVLPGDAELLELLRDRHSLIVLNKTDLPYDPGLGATLVEQFGVAVSVVAVSARTRSGLPELRDLIWETCSGSHLDSQPDYLVTDARHAELLRETVESLTDARSTLSAGFSEEVPLASLHRALNALGQITGEVTVEDIFDRVFSTFCVGK